MERSERGRPHTEAPHGLQPDSSVDAREGEWRAFLRRLAGFGIEIGGSPATRLVDPRARQGS